MKNFKKILFIIMLTIILTGCQKNSKESAVSSSTRCTLYVTCENAINSDELEKNILDILPEDGVIFSKREVVFQEGESVFDVLKRELKAEGILMESTITPGTGSVYIEGISNLYEFDCGEQSGWMYTVNGQIPNYSCSDYIVENKDVITFSYTCNLGEDIK